MAEHDKNVNFFVKKKRKIEVEKNQNESQIYSFNYIM